MALTYANTQEIEEIAKDLINLSNDYIAEINKLFTRLSEVPSTTKEWQGTQSIKYHNIIARDKTSFMNVGNQLKYIGEKLKNDALEISGCINSCANSEGKRGY